MPNIPAEQRLPAEDEIQRDPCDAPSFSLGPEFDEAVATKGKSQQVASNAATGVGGKSNHPISLDDWDANLDPEELDRLFVEAELQINARKKAKLQGSGDGLCTPSKGGAPSNPIDIGSSSGAMAKGGSPFVDYKSKATFPCSREVTEVYDVVLALGRGSSRDKSADTRSAS